MSAQRERFEVAWKAENPKLSAAVELRALPAGGYRFPHIEKDFRLFQIGEASGLDRAAKACDQIGCDWRDAGDMQKFYATNYLVEQIMALMARGESDD